MITRLLGTIGWYRIANLALLFIVFGSLVWGLNSVVMDLESRQITIIILICVSLVMLLSRLQFSNGKAALVVCLSGVIGSIYHFAGLSSPLWAIFRSLVSIPQTLLSFHAWPDLTPLALAWQQLFGQLRAPLY